MKASRFPGARRAQPSDAQGGARAPRAVVTITFDGCGINLDGRRVLTASRADWDKPEFIALARLIAAAPALLALAECEAAWLDEDGAHDALPTFQRHGFAGPLTKSTGEAFIVSLRRSALALARDGAK